MKLVSLVHEVGVMMNPTDRMALDACGELVDLASARAERDLARRTALDEYEVVAPIARGGMGGVYLANDRATGEAVAIKLLDPRFVRQEEIVGRMFAERTVSERAQHPHLVNVRAARRAPDGTPYLVIEYLDGENLGEMAERGYMEVRAVIGIGMQVAEGLAALHAAGIVHCDLKPDNVFALYEPEAIDFPYVKVIDYGVATVVGESAIDEGTIAGTPACMAPEQWRSAPVFASDVYALGCMLYELLAGDQVFGGTLPELMTAHATQVAPRASWSRSETPADLDSLIARALAKTPELRPTMREMADALAAMLPASAIRAAG